jgi:hypothetical protein
VGVEYVRRGRLIGEQDRSVRLKGLTGWRTARRLITLMDTRHVVGVLLDDGEMPVAIAK